MPNQSPSGTSLVEGVVAALGEIIAAVIGTASEVRLYKDTFTPGRTSVEADFEAAEVDCAGYAPAALTWSGIGLDAGNNATAISNRAFFQATNAVTPCTAAGAWIACTISTGPDVVKAILYFPFATPVPLTTALDFCAVVVAMQLPNFNSYVIVDS